MRNLYFKKKIHTTNKVVDFLTEEKLNSIYSVKFLGLYLSLNDRQTVTNQAGYMKPYVVHTTYLGQKTDAKTSSKFVRFNFICTFQRKAIEPHGIAEK